MDLKNYPALFRRADESSNRYQKIYIYLIKSEYSLLIFAAFFSIGLFNSKEFYIFYALIFVASIIILLIRFLRKPEQDWYRCRALAESVKTLTWRFVMRSAPFVDSETPEIPLAEFRNHLHKIFDSNREVAKKIVSDWSAEDQVTNEMTKLRNMSFEERKEFYKTNRINEQRAWYAVKARANKRLASRWVATAVTSYFIAALLVLSRIAYPNVSFLPIEPLIVFSSSIIGWVQIKKYNELTEAYTVTAHEIGLLTPTIDNAIDEPALSGAVNEAELAFSREHTLWLARQTD